MNAEREVSLVEFAATLHPEHRVNQELRALSDAYERLKAENERLRKVIQAIDGCYSRRNILQDAERWRRLDAIADAQPHMLLSVAMREAELQVRGEL
jgi:hypothetical protein